MSDALLAHYLKSIDVRLATLIKGQDKLMANVATLQQEMVELTAKVTAMSDITQSAITLINGLAAIIADLRQQLIDAQTGGATIPQAVIDQLDAFEATLQSKRDALAAAILANTAP